MEVLKKPLILQVINILFLLFGCMIIWLMSMHHSLIIAMPEDPFSRGKIYGYFFVQPHIKVIYGLAFLLLIGKEFFIKKPVKSKLKINFIFIFVLPILLLIQIMGWWYYLDNIVASY